LKSTTIAILGVSLGLAACAKSEEHQSQVNSQQPATDQNLAVPAANEEAEELAPAPRNDLLSEPKGSIDPKSVEAAGQVVQHYGALIERGHWLKAEKLWGDINAARDFATALRAKFGEVHLEIGNLAEPEGAAGSIYVSEPVAFYGQDRSGKALRRAAEITLRRVNDVPGSTEKERQWHIERIEWKTP
jgi:hypothetical protein